MNWSEDGLNNILSPPSKGFGVSNQTKSQFAPTNLTNPYSQPRCTKPIMHSKPSSCDPRLSGQKINNPTTSSYLTVSPSISRKMPVNPLPSYEEKKPIQINQMQTNVENLELDQQRITKRPYQQSTEDDIIEEYSEEPKAPLAKSEMTNRQKQLRTQNSLDFSYFNNLKGKTNNDIVNSINQNPSITTEDKKFSVYRDPCVPKTTRSSSGTIPFNLNEFDISQSKSRELQRLKPTSGTTPTGSRSRSKKPSEPQMIELLSDSDDDAKVKTTTDFYNSIDNNLIDYNPTSTSQNTFIRTEKPPETTHVPLSPLKKLFFGQIELNEVNCTLLSFSIETLPFVGFKCLYSFSKDYENVPCSHFEERIRYSDISSFQVHLMNPNEGLIAIQLRSKTELNNFVVGTGKTIDPESRAKLKLKKYIILVMDRNYYNLAQQAILYWEKVATFGDTTFFQNIIKENENSNFKNLYATALSELEIYKHYSTRNERRRLSQINTAALNIYDPKDAFTYVVYPSEPDAIDAVTIFNGDLKRLAPCVYFNDSLIDLKIKTLIADLSEDKRKKVHAFSCLFYAKLTEIKNDAEKAYALVERWTKNVNLFDLDYILLPINLNNHWSLIVVTQPAKLVDFDKQPANNKNVKPEETDDNMVVIESPSEPECVSVEDIPCILHLDSLSMHPTATIARTITRYLYHERNTKILKKNISSEVPTKSDPSLERPEEQDQEEDEEEPTTPSHKETNVQNYKFDSFTELVDTEPEIETPMHQKKKTYSRKNNTKGKGKEKVNDKVQQLKEFENRIPIVKCKVPKQHNGYDCGVFVIRFAEMILKIWPTSNSFDIKTKFADQFAKEFSQSDIDIERVSIKELLAKLRENWIEIRKKYIEEQAKEEEEENEKEIDSTKENNINDSINPSDIDNDITNNIDTSEDKMEVSHDHGLTQTLTIQYASSEDSTSSQDPNPSIPLYNNYSEDSSDDLMPLIIEDTLNIGKHQLPKTLSPQNSNQYSLMQNSLKTDNFKPKTSSRKIEETIQDIKTTPSTPQDVHVESFHQQFFNQSLQHSIIDELPEVQTPPTIVSRPTNKEKLSALFKSKKQETKPSQISINTNQTKINREIDLSSSPTNEIREDDEEIEISSSRNRATISSSTI